MQTCKRANVHACQPMWPNRWLVHGRSCCQRLRICKLDLFVVCAKEMFVTNKKAKKRKDDIIGTASW